MCVNLYVLLALYKLILAINSAENQPEMPPAEYQP